MSSEDGSPRLLIGFSSKGALITSDCLSSFAGKRGAAGGRRVGRGKEIVSGPGYSDSRGTERGRESALAAFFSSDIISSNFLFVSCKEVTVSFLLLEASK